MHERGGFREVLRPKYGLKDGCPSVGQDEGKIAVREKKHRVINSIVYLDKGI